MPSAFANLSLPFAALAAALLAAPGAALGQSDLAQAALAAGPRLVFSVSGVAAGAPDRAIVSVGVEAQGKTAAEAMAEQARRMTDVVAAAQAAAGDGGRVETAGLSLSPLYSDRSGSYQDAPLVAGYSAANIVTVTLTDLEAVGETLDALVDAGADRIDGVRFDLADRTELEAAARRAALAALAARRAFYAGEGGLALGGLMELTEEAQGGGGGPMMRMADASTPVLPGEVHAQVTLRAVYRLAE